MESSGYLNTHIDFGGLGRQPEPSAILGQAMQDRFARLDFLMATHAAAGEDGRDAVLAQVRETFAEIEGILLLAELMSRPQ